MGRIHDVNARGAFLMTRETARAMVASQYGGRIVNIASNALRGGLIKGLVSYASSKGALAALSHRVRIGRALNHRQHGPARGSHHPRRDQR